MKSKQTLATKFAIIFILFGVVSTALLGFVVYKNENRIHKDYQLDEVQNVNSYLNCLIMEDADDFYSFVKLLPEYADEMHIPMEISDFSSAYDGFFDLFISEFPDRFLGNGVNINELEGETLIRYLEYDYIYWTVTFRNAQEKFGLRYLYILRPCTEDGSAAYIVDVMPTEREDCPGEMEVYYIDPPGENDEDEVPILWKTWRKGEELYTFQVWDNEFGHTYSYYTPVVINNEIIALIVGEVDIEKINSVALKNTLRIIGMMAAVYFICGAGMYWLIRVLYVKKLMSINENIGRFAKTKDYSIADKIKSTKSSVFEINSLSTQISRMIKDLKHYVDNYVEVQELYKDSKAREAVASSLAMKDSLTGAYNKMAYDTTCERVDRMIKNGNTEFGIAMIDLNFLKKLNDTYGHARGNSAIMNLYEIISDIYPSGNIFRIGGDEFVVILDAQRCRRAAEDRKKFMDIIQETSLDTSKRPWNRVSAAIGVAIFDTELDKTIADTFKRADVLMYENKKLMKGVRED